MLPTCPAATRLAPLPTQPSRPPVNCHAPFCTLQMDPLAQTLFYIAFTIGLIILWMVWRHFLWAEKFFMQARAVLRCATCTEHVWRSTHRGVPFMAVLRASAFVVAPHTGCCKAHVYRWQAVPSFSWVFS